MKIEIAKEELLLLSKKELVSLAKEQAQEIAEGGQEDPLRIYIESKRLSDYYGELNTRLTKPAQEEAAKHGKQGASVFGALASVVSTAAKLDFSKCNDPALITLTEAFEEAKKALDDRKKFLQGLPASGVVITDEETGEQSKVYPPVKISGETLKVIY